MKSYVSFLEGLYRAILEDCAVEYPSSAAEWTRDLSRLRFGLEHRGSGFATKDLPAAGKHFDKCLARGLYQPSRQALNKPRRKGNTNSGTILGADVESVR
jgi:hypothetical protein